VHDIGGRNSPLHPVVLAYRQALRVIVVDDDRQFIRRDRRQRTGG
jgi:hypothetical protein